MEYKNLLLDIIKEYFEDVLVPRRNVVLMTGEGGYDMFQISTEEIQGLTRFYLGTKVMRIIRQRIKHPIRRDYRKRYYYLYKKAPH